MLNHPRRLLMLAVPILVVGAAFATRDQWDWLLEDGTPRTVGAVAPALDDVDADTERLYRIASDDRSRVTYEVEETLAGTSKTATGSTTAVAGDIAVDLEDPADSRIGTIVVNVEQLSSDSELRDKRIRGEFLDSSEHPMAEFTATSVDGLPATIDGDAETELTVEGDLTVKETTAPVTFRGSARMTDDLLEASMTATVLMSDFDVGPINVAGLVRTGDEVELSFDLVAERTDPDEPAPGGAVLLLDEVMIPEGEFAAFVQPIIEERCASCHVDGGAGSHTVEMSTAGDVAEIAADIKLVTQAGYMPPWPASDVGLAMRHDLSIEPDEVEVLAEWADAGGGLDVPADTPLDPIELPFDEIDRDIVTAPAEPYVGSTDRPDDYRCVISEVPDPEGDGTWVVGYHFEPDEDEIVHHSIISAVAPESRERIDELDAAEEGSGFTCYGQVTSMRDVNATGFGGWTPGRQATRFPDGYARFLPPGTFLVNQVHYHYDHDTPPDRSSIVLDTVPTPEADALAEAGTPLLPIVGRTYINPAEGPCTPEETGPLCDRNAMLDEIERKYGGFARALPDIFVRGCGGTVDDYDDLDGTRFSSSCDHRARLTGTLYSVLPHMHEFGAAYRMTLNPDTPDERVLIDIPDWQFGWQFQYEPDEEVRIEADDVIRVECTWDRARMPMEEPYYITWSDGTSDEMCFSPIGVLPDP